MKQQDYHCSIATNVPAEEAFEKINLVSDWWTQKGFTGSSQKLGDVFTVRWGETFAEIEIAEVIPGKKIVWRVQNSNLHWLKDKSEWNNTRIEWEISSQNGATNVSMTHRGLVPTVECYNNCKEGWDFYAGKSLLKFLNENKGLPDGRTRST